MTVTGHRVSASRRLNEDLRPDEAGLNMNRSHFADGDAHFVLAEPGALPPRDSFVAHLDNGWKQEIASGQPARSENFACHKMSEKIGGRGGIRTPGTVTRTPDFESDHALSFLGKYAIFPGKSRVRSRAYYVRP